MPETWTDEQAFDLARRLCTAHGDDPDRRIDRGHPDGGKMAWQIFLPMATEALITLWPQVTSLAERCEEAEKFADLNITDRERALKGDVAAYQAKVGELEQYARDATKAITSLTVGGSEYFGRKIGEMYTADLALCVKHIRERETRSHEWMTKAVAERIAAEAKVAALIAEIEALKEIINQIYVDVQASRDSAFVSNVEG